MLLEEAHSETHDSCSTEGTTCQDTYLFGNVCSGWFTFAIFCNHVAILLQTQMLQLLDLTSLVEFSLFL